MVGYSKLNREVFSFQIQRAINVDVITERYVGVEICRRRANQSRFRILVFLENNVNCNDINILATSLFILKYKTYLD